MKAQIIKFLKDEEGATAIEYGLMAGLIAVAILLSVEGIGERLSQVFADIRDALPEVRTTTTPG